MSTKTALEMTITRAAELAYEEDANQVIGRIGGRWEIASCEDWGRINQMVRPLFRVSSDGLAESASTIMDIMESAGIDGDQDWEKETTTYQIDEDRFVVSGPSFELNP